VLTLENTTGRVLITGGAGFIGSRLAWRLLARGREVVVLDNLSRRGSAENLAWLETSDAGNLRFVRGDVRSREDVERATAGSDAIVHLAGQVAVTTSLEDPIGDLEHNVLGTVNVLEAARRVARPRLVIYASSNKVYGALADVRVEARETRYELLDLPWGIPETMPVNPTSPYGCSKCAGELYALDWWRVFGVPTVVFRQSCIFGPNQWGSEDQGWTAWFAGRALRNEPVTIFGDGRQVRDLLYIEDLIDAYELALADPQRVVGKVYNLAGGPERALSVWYDFGTLLESLLGHPLDARFGPWRAGDQRVAVLDIRRIESELGWAPRTSVEDGVRLMLEWLDRGAGGARE
jgi:CDP-paratose 2-epimerase